MAKKKKEADPDQDTLAEWLWWRFRGQAEGTNWEQLPQETKSYWQHEADAVKRAVERGGFKNYTPQEVTTNGPTESHHEAQ